MKKARKDHRVRRGIAALLTAVLLALTLAPIAAAQTGAAEEPPAAVENAGKEDGAKESIAPDTGDKIYIVVCVLLLAASGSVFLFAMRKFRWKDPR